MTRSDTPAPTTGARTVRVPEDRDGQRLDNFLLGQLKGAPRSLIYKLVRSGQVRVNGGRAKAERKLAGGDEVRIPPVRLGEEGPKQAPPGGFLKAMEAAIVFEDARLLALNKPSGVASHGGSGISFGAIETLRALRPRESLELVHRLDRDTSGLLLLARSDAVHAALQAALRAREIERAYLALVDGRPAARRGTIDAPLGRDRRVRTRMSTDTDDQRDAVTHFEVAENLPRATLLRVRLETGRTHQIRAHLKAIGHPVLGDPEYGVPDYGLARQFLHAAGLAFTHPVTGVEIALASELPDDLDEALQKAS